MIIKFQIYSILHPIPSKGILESHTNVLLNRKRILKFYFTNSFLLLLLVLVRERSLQPTFVIHLCTNHPPFPPTVQSARFAAQVLSVCMDGPGMLCSPRVLGSDVFRLEFLCAFPEAWCPDGRQEGCRRRGLWS